MKEHKIHEISKLVKIRSGAEEKTEKGKEIDRKEIDRKRQGDSETQRGIDEAEEDTEGGEEKEKGKEAEEQKEKE